MRSFILGVGLFLSLATFADTPQWNPGPRDAENRAMENGIRNNQDEIQKIARREYQRSLRPHKSANCGKSFWTKSEALNYCPPATAMKIHQDGEIFYHCDCND